MVSVRNSSMIECPRHVMRTIGWNCQGFHKDTVEFYFESRDMCKNFWKVCLENHAFFRCQSVKLLPRRRGAVLSRGSSFRSDPLIRLKIVVSGNLT